MEGVDVRISDSVIARDPRVAAAISAEAFAEGNMHVKRGARAKLARERLEPLALGRGFRPIRHRRVARVPRPWNVVLTEELLRIHYPKHSFWSRMKSLTFSSGV